MPEGKRPSIAVLATGGTIAGVRVQDDAHAYRAGALSVEHLLAAVPGLDRLAHIQAEQLANVGSQDMSFAIWAALARRVDALCQDPDIDGIVITHGTDTVEETAYFLSLVIRHDKPVVLTGAMRPATALGADGPANVLYAVALAASDSARARGPLVVMNEDIHYAREVQKVACNGIDAFASPNRGRAGVMRGERAVFYSRNEPRHTVNSAFSVDLLDRAWPRVDILFATVDLNHDVVDYLSARARAIVLSGVGDGNGSQAVLQALHRAVQRGVIVARASRCGSGHVARNVEVDDEAMGFIAVGDLSPQKARILLMLGLMKTSDPVELQTLFDEY
ncbi:asparaginase [Bordetella sp. 15P40C-2]|uniref:asparaginase n=1 Tax=Bordetella sp. 15P40C-2 TaxID=2572246 RepID=UPI0013298F38|nr:asparaginase [Bordetella sp. 15P40C-2]MVW71554.1 type II asparaginase [Bordetella sp. 15P40C-2]